MTRTGVALVALRLAAVYVALDVVLTATSLGMLVADDVPDARRSGMVSGFALVVVLKSLLAWIVYWTAPRLARFVGGDEPTEPAIDRLSVGSLALRIAGILMLDQWLGYAQSMSMTWNRIRAGIDGDREWLHFVMPTLLGLLAIGLVLRPGWLARRLFGASLPSDAPKSAVIQAVAFSVLGLWFVVGALPGFVDQLAFSVRRGSLHGLMGAGEDSGLGWSWPEIATIVRLVAGMLVFLGGGVLAKTWHRWRAAGVAQPAAGGRAGAEES